MVSLYIVKGQKTLYLALANKYTKPDLGDLVDTTQNYVAKIVLTKNYIPFYKNLIQF